MQLAYIWKLAHVQVPAQCSGGHFLMRPVEPLLTTWHSIPVACPQAAASPNSIDAVPQRASHVSTAGTVP